MEVSHYVNWNNTVYRKGAVHRTDIGWSFLAGKGFNTNSVHFLPPYHVIVRWGTHLYMLLFLSIYLYVHPSVALISLGFLCQFFKILIFQVVRGDKSAKIGPKWQTFCQSCSISQEPFIRWLSFMLHLCKMIYLQVVFLFFQNFDFSDCYGAKSPKNGSKW